MSHDIAVEFLEKFMKLAEEADVALDLAAYTPTPVSTSPDLTHTQLSGVTGAGSITSGLGGVITSGLVSGNTYFTSGPMSGNITVSSGTGLVPGNIAVSNGSIPKVRFAESPTPSVEELHQHIQRLETNVKALNVTLRQTNIDMAEMKEFMRTEQEVFMDSVNADERLTGTVVELLPCQVVYCSLCGAQNPPITPDDIELHRACEDEFAQAVFDAEVAEALISDPLPGADAEEHLIDQESDSPTQKSVEVETKTKTKTKTETDPPSQKCLPDVVETDAEGSIVVHGATDAESAQQLLDLAMQRHHDELTEAAEEPDTAEAAHMNALHADMDEDKQLQGEMVHIKKQQQAWRECQSALREHQIHMKQIERKYQTHVDQLEKEYQEWAVLQTETTAQIEQAAVAEKAARAVQKTKTEEQLEAAVAVEKAARAVQELGAQTLQADRGALESRARAVHAQRRVDLAQQAAYAAYKAMLWEELPASEKRRRVAEQKAYEEQEQRDEEAGHEVKATYENQKEMAEREDRVVMNMREAMYVVEETVAEREETSMMEDTDWIQNESEQFENERRQRNKTKREAREAQAVRTAADAKRKVVKTLLEAREKARSTEQWDTVCAAMTENTRQVEAEREAREKEELEKVRQAMIEREAQAARATADAKRKEMIARNAREQDLSTEQWDTLVAAVDEDTRQWKAEDEALKARREAVKAKNDAEDLAEMQKMTHAEWSQRTEALKESQESSHAEWLQRTEELAERTRQEAREVVRVEEVRQSKIRAEWQRQAAALAEKTKLETQEKVRVEAALHERVQVEYLRRTRAEQAQRDAYEKEQLERASHLNIQLEHLRREKIERESREAEQLEKERQMRIQIEHLRQAGEEMKRRHRLDGDLRLTEKTEQVSAMRRRQLHAQQAEDLFLQNDPSAATSVVGLAWLLASGSADESEDEDASEDTPLLGPE